MMNNILSPSEHIDQVQTKVMKLLKQYRQLEKDNERLKAELSRKNENDEIILQKSRQLERQLNMMKATAGSGDDKTTLCACIFYVRTNCGVSLSTS